MTPKLRLSDADRKVLLSCILKSRCPGIWRIIKSTHIILDPTMHAGLSQNLETNDLSMNATESPTNPTDTAHDPSSSIVVKHHARSVVCGLAARVYLEVLIRGRV